MTASKPRYRLKATAIERNAGQRTSWWRFTRSVVLGTVALTLAVLWVGEQYGVEREEILRFLGMGGLFVGTLVAAALVGVAVLILVRRLLKR